MQAFLGLGQMRKLENIVKNRNKNYNLYRRLLKTDVWQPPLSTSRNYISNFAFPAISPKREDIVKNLQKHSVVSEKVAKEMATNAMKIFNSDYSISTTGNAGPSVSDNLSKIGDCFISIASKEIVVCKKMNIDCDRESFISNITEESLKFFINTIIKN